MTTQPAPRTDTPMAPVAHSPAVAFSPAVSWAFTVSSPVKVRVGPRADDETIDALIGESRRVLVVLAKHYKPGGTAIITLEDLMAASGCSKNRLRWILQILTIAQLIGKPRAVETATGLVLQVELRMGVCQEPKVRDSEQLTDFSGSARDPQKSGGTA